MLQGFPHDTETITVSSLRGESWALGQTRTTVTLLPNQRIMAEMEDTVVVHAELRTVSSAMGTMSP